MPSICNRCHKGSMQGGGGDRVQRCWESSIEETEQPSRVATADQDQLSGIIDRSDELERLDQLLDDVKAGFGRTVLIRGPAGIGKTHLLSALRDRARLADLTTLAARGGELERDYPFGCVRQMFEPVIRASGDEMSFALSGDAALAERVFRQPSEQDEVQAGDPGHGVLHGLYWLTANLAERSAMLLTLDDAHWADPASLRYLSFLGRRLERVPTLVAATTRWADTSSDDRVLTQIAQDPLTELVDLEPLNLAGVSAFMRSQLGREVTPEMAALCHEATGGNPFLVKEIMVEISRKSGSLDLDEILSRGPARVAEAIEARLAGIGESGPAMARAIAVLGDHADMRIAAALGGIEPDQAVSITDALVSESILDSTHPLRFIHPIVQKAVYGRMGPAERSRWHGRAATLLADAGQSDEVVALHLLATEPDGQPAVVELLRRAAESASARGSPESAVRFLDRALKEPPVGEARSQVLVQLGRSAAPLGDERALDWLRSGMRLGEGTPTGIEAAVALGMALIFVGEDAEVLELCEGIRSAAGDGGTEGARIEQWLTSLGQVSPSTREPTLPLVRDNLAAALAGRELGPSALACAALESAMTDGDAITAGDFAERSVADGLLEVSGPDSLEPVVASLALTFCERFRASEDLMNAGQEIVRSEGDPRGFAGSIAFRALARLRAGKVRDVLADAELYPGSDKPSIADLVMASCYLGALVDSGRLDEAQAIGDAIESVPVNRMLTIYQLFDESLVSLKLAQADPAGALEVTGRISKWEERMELVSGTSVNWRSPAAIAHFMRGDSELALELAEEQVTRSRAFGAPGMLGVSLRALGVVSEGSHGISALHEAVEILDHSQRRLEKARALVDLGSALRRSGQDKAAREFLREGSAIANDCGADGLSSRALDELVASGGRPRRAAGEQVESLTPSERRVADMAADGLTNKEIAQTLFVTVKTVETHLRHVYSKLDIKSRAQLASRLNP